MRLRTLAVLTATASLLTITPAITQALGATEAAAATEPVTTDRILFFGDSLIEGCCRTTSTDPKMGKVAGTRLGFTTIIEKGYGGTGYTTGGPVAGRLPFPDKLPSILDANPDLDVLVIAGGINDPSSLTVDQLRPAVRRTFTIARDKTALRGTRVFIVGPHSPNASGKANVRAVLKEQAALFGWPYIDQITLEWGKAAREAGRLHTDLVHWNSRGHKWAGQQLAAELALAGCPVRR